MNRVVLLVFLSFVVNADVFARGDANENAIDARNGEMQLRSFYVGPMFAMAKGKTPYDAAVAAELATNLKRLTELDSSRFWPKGSDISAYPRKTSAKQSLWLTYPQVMDYAKNYKDAVNTLAIEAGKGLDSLRSAVGPVGKSCKSCHDEFRKKN